MRELYAVIHFVKTRLFLEYTSVFTNYLLAAFTVFLKKSHKKIPGANCCRGFVWTIPFLFAGTG